MEPQNIVSGWSDFIVRKRIGPIPGSEPCPMLFNPRFGLFNGPTSYQSSVALPSAFSCTSATLCP